MHICIFPLPRLREWKWDAQHEKNAIFLCTCFISICECIDFVFTVLKLIRSIEKAIAKKQCVKKQFYVRVFTCIWTSDIEFHKLKFITRNNFDIKVKRNVIRRHCFRTIMTKTRIKCDSPKRIGWEEIWKRKGDQWRYQSPFKPLFWFIENTFLIQNTNW